MGTHPIFESDFDCLTDEKMRDEVLDELEALQSLYDDVRILSETCWEIPLKSDKGFEAQLRVELTCSYPETFPNISITAYWMDALNKACLLSRMESEFDPGCPGVITWAEMLREELSNYEEKQKDTVEPQKTEEKIIKEETKVSKSPEIEVFTSDIIVDRKSIFQAFYANINSALEAEQFRQQLLQNNKIKNATHNMFVWKVNENGIIKSDSDEDGESGAASRMMHLVDLTGACNFAVIVSRWYGGIHLGPDRWKHINNSLRTILDEHDQIKRKK